ncbi:MAG: hypothetical protein DELT_02104 [Desulfovibrio sp.]
MKTTYCFSPAKVVLALCIALTLAVAGCATPRQGPPLPEVKLAVAEFTQPHSTADMLAGYMAEDAPRVSQKELTELDAAFGHVLRKETKRVYASPESYLECRNALPAGQTAGRVGALRRWVAVGECLKVDFLIVPQIYHLQEREGGEAGVTRPAGVVMDIFLIDVKNAALTSRSHFDETQTALAENLLNTGKFFSRGGKWITAVQLATEGMQKAVKDLGL